LRKEHEFIFGDPCSILISRLDFSAKLEKEKVFASVHHLQNILPNLQLLFIPNHLDTVADIDLLTHTLEHQCTSLNVSRDTVFC